MKKICIILTLTALLAVSPCVSAKELSIISGVSYTTIKEEERWPDEAKFGGIFGIYIGVTEQLTSRLSVAAQYELFTTGYLLNIGVDVDPEEILLIIGGITGNISYSLTDFLSINGGLGYYFPRMEIGDHQRIMTQTIGYKLGITVHKQFKDNLNFLASANYRILTTEMPNYGPYDLSGPEISIGLVYKY